MENSKHTVDRESGQTMAEYAVTLTVIAIGVIVALGLLSSSVASVMARTAAAM